ncbi:MAG: aldehyde dehydrogenase family protein [Dermatophilaceae bacterium]
MAELDADLVSIQEARSLAVAAKAAQKQFMAADQAQVDRICQAMVDAIMRDSARLAQLAHDETGYGVTAHKTLKIEFAAKGVWDSIKDTPTVGVLRRDEARGIIEIGWPVGVVVGLTPSTNPNSTAIFKVLISVKARNAIIVAPHPSAARATYEAVRLMAEAGERAGMPKGLVSCMQNSTLQGSQELMKHHATSLILATGGTPMVRAAHSTGKPALGVGPGNVPVYVDRSADVRAAAEAIVNSKSFDCSVICATEQAVVADAPIAAQLRSEMAALGAYWVPPADKPALERLLFTSSGGMNPAAVGRTPQALAAAAGIKVPQRPGSSSSTSRRWAGTSPCRGRSSPPFSASMSPTGGGPAASGPSSCSAMAATATPWSSTPATRTSSSPSAWRSRPSGSSSTPGAPWAPSARPPGSCPRSPSARAGSAAPSSATTSR